MSKIGQQKNQIEVMVKILRASLKRIVESFNLNDTAIKEAILLHCVMISLYQKFDDLLASPEFVAFFNKNLAHLEDEKICQSTFSKVPDDFKFAPSPFISNQDLNFLIQFSSVVILEARNMLDKKYAHGEYLKNITLPIVAAGWLAFMLFILTFYGYMLFGLIITGVMPALAIGITAPVLIALLTLSIILVIAVICNKVGQSTHDYVRQVREKLSEIQYINLQIFLEQVRCQRFYTGTLEVPIIKNLLPEPRNPGAENVFAKVQSLFFKLPDNLKITNQDVEFDLSQKNI